MDLFHFDFHTTSTLANDTNSDGSNLDWTAFQSSSPTITNSSLSSVQSLQQDDAVAPINRTNIEITSDDEMNFEIERLFNGLNQQQEQGIIEPIPMNIDILNQSYVEPSHRIHLSSVINERQPTCLPTQLIPCLASLPRLPYHHKLPSHAVKLMQEWYNANLDDPYPSLPDKKRFITEGNITAQQCRSWFANRRQRLKKFKRNQPKTSISRFHHSIRPKPTELSYVEEQPEIPTFNVVINQQTIEQLIHDSLRRLLYPTDT